MVSIYNKFGDKVISHMAGIKKLSPEEKAEQIEQAYEIHRQNPNVLHVAPAQIIQSKPDEIEDCWNSYMPHLNEAMEKDLDMRQVSLDEKWGIIGEPFVKERDLEKGFKIINAEQRARELGLEIFRGSTEGLDSINFIMRDLGKGRDSKTYSHKGKVGSKSTRNLFIRNVEELKAYIALRDSAKDKGEPFNSSIYVLGNKLMTDLDKNGKAISTTDLGKISLLETICTEQDCGVNVTNQTEFRNSSPAVNSIGTKAEIAKLKYNMQQGKRAQMKVIEVQFQPPKLVDHHPIYGSRSLQN